MVPEIRRKRGLPQQIVDAEEEVEEQRIRTETLEEHIEELFGPQLHAGEAPPNPHGLPSLVWLKENYKTKSAAIRYLISQGFMVKHIAKHLNIRYQHVRNVATKVLKRGPNESWRPLTQRLDYKPREDSNGVSRSEEAERTDTTGRNTPKDYNP